MVRGRGAGVSGTGPALPRTKTRGPDEGSRPRVLAGTLLTLGFAEVLLLSGGRRDYPNLHEILDTAMFLLSGVLSLLLWDMGARLSRPLLRWLAISFIVTSCLELLHVLTTIGGDLGFVSRWEGTLRPSSWPPGAYCLATGAAAAVLLTARRIERAPWFAPALVLFTAALYPVFFWLPQYTTPQWFGITRPTLVLVPLLWLLVCWTCWKVRHMDRILPMVALMGAVQFFAHIAMLYSRAPHDTAAMVAHLGKVGSDLLFLLTLINMASFDMRRLVRAEASLSELNVNLGHRVRERTEQLATTHQRLELEVGERERMQQRLQESRRLLQAILDNSPTVIYVKDLNGRYLLVNRRFAQIFHVVEDDVVGKTDFDIFPAEVAAGMRALDARVVATRSASMEEELVPHDRALDRGSSDRAASPSGDGRRTYLSVRSPLWSHTGSVFAVCGIAADITERKEVEGRLRAQLARLSLLHRISRAIAERQSLPSILEAVISHVESDLPLDFTCACLYDAADEALIVTSVGAGSRGLAERLKLAEGARIPIDQNGLARCVKGDLVYEPDLEGLPFSFAERLAGGELRALVIAPLQVESEVFGILVAGRRARASFDSADCEFLRQLSEHAALAAHQARLYGALESSYNDLRQTQAAAMQQARLSALGQMATGVAHDINNAITPIAIYTETLLETEQELSPQGRGYLQIIDRAISDVAQTVARLRAFHRRREPSLTTTVVRMNLLVEQVVSLTRARWSDIPQQRGAVIDLELDLAADLPGVQGDESEIREALINLVFNAVDAMPGGGRLGLRTGVESDSAGSDSRSGALRVRRDLRQRSWYGRGDATALSRALLHDERQQWQRAWAGDGVRHGRAP
jgi:PAS domain S-box-containing protein